MSILFLLMIWAVLSLPIGIALGKRMAEQERKWNDEMGGLNSPKDAQQLAAEVMTEENKDQVMQRFKYHENRMRHGAEFEVSYKRLINELKSFRKEDEDD